MNEASSPMQAARTSVFNYCPSCGKAGIEWVAERFWRCPVCSFEYFHNIATASGLLIENRDRLLVLERARDPSKGLLAFPGGFVDPGERAEAAARRECREEIGWEPDTIEFFASFPNIYVYRGVSYNTCDFYFLTRADGLEIEDLSPDPYEIAGVWYLPLADLSLEKLAFESSKKAARLLMTTRGLI